MFPALPPLAFGFAHWPMLFWLAAAAAPLVIHLLSRQRHREMSWAAMEYLLSALRRRARTIRIEQWLLLLLRTLLIVLVVLAASEPYVERPGLFFAPGAATHRVLVLDASYSMAAKPADQTRFEQAKQWAGRLVDQSPPGDAFTLVLLAAPPRVVVGTPTSEPAAMREEIESLGILDTGADLPATVRAVGQLLDKARRQCPRLQRQVVYFLTDLQRTTWAPDLKEADLAGFRSGMAGLAHSAALEIIDLGQPQIENLAVTDLVSSEAVVTAGHAVVLAAQVRNFGRHDRRRQAIELWIDGHRAGRQTKTVPAGGEVWAHFSHRFETPGDHILEVRAPGDALDVDNHRFRVIPVRQALRVLCIDGRPAGDAAGGTTRYLATALAPDAGRAEHPPVGVAVASESAILERDLSAYDCVFLCNVARFTADEARALDACLAQGGNLVFFLGDQVVLDQYNRQLGGEGGGRRLLPYRLERIVSAPQLGLDPLDYKHPIVAAFRGQTNSGLLNTIISKHVKLVPWQDPAAQKDLAEGSAAKVALSMANGDPLVVEQPVRRGRVVLVATSADVSWTPMPVWFSYVPLVQEILAFTVGEQINQRNVEVGQPLADGVAPAAGDVPVTVERPDGRVQSVPLRAGGGDGEWTCADTYRSGIYTVRFGPPLERTRSFAVNVNTGESDLAPATIEELRSQVLPGVPLGCRSDPTAPGSPAARPASVVGGLHVELLYALAALLLVETFLAWRFGHPR